MKHKILICEFSQESNSFNPIIWDVDRFKSMVMCGGLKMKIIYKLIKSPVKGMADAVKKHGGSSVFGFAMRAMSGGPVSDESVELFIDKTVKKIEEKGPFDGILLSLHGATISESREDACGYITEKIRERVPDTVMGLSCDMHANVTHRMQENADFICGFQTYPHVDFYQTGYRAAELVMERLAGSSTKQVYCRIPMMVPASGYTSKEGRFGDIIKKCHAISGKDGIKDVTVFMMQPWLDVSEAASCVTIAADNEDAAHKKAAELASELFEAREEFWPRLSDPKEAIETAAVLSQDKTKGPVVLAEPSDSPNAGAVGDSIEVLEKLAASDYDISAAFCVMDPEAAARAFDLGEGKSAVFSLGAGYTPGMGSSLELECTVKSLHKGKFRMAGPAGKGLTLSIGRTAVLSSGKTDIMICEKPGGNGDLNFYRGFGIDPVKYDIVSVKANTSFRESYKDITDKIFIADTYGAASGNLTSLPFNKIDKENFYPFNPSPQWSAEIN